MFRKKFAEKYAEQAAEQKFANRGGSVVRLEAFSDAAFAFSLTMLVISLQPPRDYRELMTTLQGAPAFAITFAMLMLIWYEHFIYFRRYGLEDALTVALNSALMFVIVLYVYPLKFLFTILVASVLGQDISFMSNGVRHSPMDNGHIPSLMVVYGLGFVAIYGLFTLLYVRAYAARTELELNAVEIFDTRSKIFEHLGMALIGLVSVLAASLLRGDVTGEIAGFTYFLIPVHQTWIGTQRGKMRRKMLASMPKT